MDLDTLYADFLTYQEARGCAPLTISAYRGDFRCLSEFLKSSSTPLELASLDAPTIRRYLVWLRQRGLKQWSIRRRMCSLRAFLGYCVDEELLERHPMTRVPTPKAPKTLPRYLTFDEVQRVFQAIGSSTSKFRLRDRALVRVLLFAGLRRSELLRMTWDDIDFRHGTLRVLGKGKRERIIPLELETLDCLGMHRAASLFTGKEQVWLNREGAPMTPDSLGRTIKRWMRKAKIDKNVTPHVWRHTCATLLVQNGAPLSNVQELLGHSSLATTSVYTHCDPAQSRHTVSGLADKISRGSD